MAKNVLQSTILSANGAVAIAPGAQIEVRSPSGLLVPLWLDRDGTQPTTNPITADSDGFFRVYLDSGRYHITARSGGESREWRDVLLGSAAGYDVGTEPDQVPTNALLGSAAGYDVTTSPTDTTPGRVLTVGSLGLGKPTADPATPITGSLLSGAMLAAGAIVEMGENANGSYWRWENGLQICFFRFTSSGTPITWTFPAAFVAVPVVQVSGRWSGSNPVIMNFVNEPNTTSVTIRKWYWRGSDWGEAASEYPHLLAIGRWK